MSNNTLEKLVSTSSIGGGPGGGFLTIDQANTFIDHVFDSAVLWKEATKKKMNSQYAEWSEVRVGARVIRTAVEGVDNGVNARPTFSKISISTIKIRLDWEVTRETLEDNIEKDSFDEHLLRLMSHRLGEDLEELSIWGDTTGSVEALRGLDGWHKQALNNSHVVQADTSGTNGQLSRKHFYQALRTMPQKYARNVQNQRFYVSSAAFSDYLFSQSESGIVPNEIVAGALRGPAPLAQGAAGDRTPYPFGIPLVEVPMFDSHANVNNAGTGVGPSDTNTFLEYTDPANRIVGMQREIQMHKNYVAKKDAIEYTAYVRFGIGWVNPDAVVTVTGIPLADI